MIILRVFDVVLVFCLMAFSLIFRRFWTRNRPGDTVLERSEEGLLMQAARRDQLDREELEHERSEEMNMPGLGFEGGLLEQLQQQGR